MQTAITVLGYVFAVALTISGVALAIAGAATQVSKALDRWQVLCQRLERKDIGNSLMSAAWWFSEDERTMHLLQAFASELNAGLEPLDIVDRVREKWRKAA